MKRALILSLLLTGCGGGGDTVACPPIADHLNAINAGRAKQAQCGPATGPLSVNGTLQHVAQQHAEYLASTQPDLSGPAIRLHYDSQGRRVQGRLADVGHQRFAEEVAAAGFDTADKVMSAYKASAGHCPWVMWPDAAEIGLGCAVSKDNRAYWVHVLGMGP